MAVQYHQGEDLQESAKAQRLLPKKISKNLALGSTLTNPRELQNSSAGEKYSIGIMAP